MDRLLAFREDIEAASPYPLVEPHFWPNDGDRADRAGWWIATDRVSDLDNEKLWPDYHKHVAERIAALHQATDRYVRLVQSGGDLAPASH